MRIGDVATQSGLSASRIRFYEKHGLIPPAARTGNGYRDYPESTVGTLRLIDEAQGLGFSLTEIAAYLSQPDRSNRAKKRELYDALRHKLETMDQHLQEVMRRRQRVAGLIQRMEEMYSFQE
ncbi:MAG: MerR family transcriptional regulator [Azospirillaceae bacterium]|nr:MerR family transcriptional regulator [Azospirillaceae bacterium]